MAQAHPFDVDEPCPVPDKFFAELLGSGPHGVDMLIATVDPAVRVMLSIYCYKRAHLEPLDLRLRQPAGSSH